MAGKMQIYDSSGARLYLTGEERKAFEMEAEKYPRETSTFALFMLQTGCRISEALALRSDLIDMSNQSVRIESLKKRKKGVFREIPLSPALLKALDYSFDLQAKRKAPFNLWKFSRTSAWRKITEIMEQAGIEGVHATPKGLRHGFAIACVEHKIPLNMISKWLGHSSLETTAIYATASGQEERNIASRLWL